MTYPTRRPGWNPFAEIDTMRGEIGRVLASALSGSRGGWSPDVEVDEAPEAWTVTVRLPGFASEEVAIELDDRELVVRSAHEEQDGTGGGQGSFRYRMAVPSDVDPDAVDATMDHGLLLIRLPRTGRPRARQIRIGSRSQPGGTLTATVPPVGGTGERPDPAGAGTVTTGAPPTAAPPGAERESAAGRRRSASV